MPVLQQKNIPKQENINDHKHKNKPPKELEK